MEFNKLGLKECIVNALKQNGYQYPTPIQQKAIPEILNGNDIVGRSQTGSGKTFAYGLPIINKIDNTSANLQALIICPTRELAMQVADEIKKIASLCDVQVCAVFGGSSIDRQIKSLKNNPKILVGTPGRLIDLLNKKKLCLNEISTLVLDEADEMLDMGFRPDIEKILKATNSNRQTLLFSATIPQGIREIINNYQKNSVVIELGVENKAIDKIEQRYLFVDQKNKKELLKELFYTDVFGKTILFVNTKRYSEDLEDFLNKNNISSKAIHGDLRQSERKRVLQNFKDEKFDVLIATDVAARGLDIKQVEWVINYDLPQQLEYYVHRIGRTARAGQAGKVIDIITNLSQMSYMREIEKQTKAKIDKYQSANHTILDMVVDTKKLAKTSGRFGAKSKRDLLAEEMQNKKARRFGGANLGNYFTEKEDKKTKRMSKKEKTLSKAKFAESENERVSFEKKFKQVEIVEQKNLKLKRNKQSNTSKPLKNTRGKGKIIKTSKSTKNKQKTSATKKWFEKFTK